MEEQWYQRFFEGSDLLLDFEVSEYLTIHYIKNEKGKCERLYFLTINRVDEIVFLTTFYIVKERKFENVLLDCKCRS